MLVKVVGPNEQFNFFNIDPQCTCTQTRILAGFTEITSIMIHGTVFQHILIHRLVTKMVDRGVRKISWPPPSFYQIAFHVSVKSSLV